ncbi:MAG: transcription/translation regulatory transformer protein RfaH [Porticoccaceae bacterium]
MKGWFLVQTKPQQETRALENLQQQGVNAFCPQVLVEKLSRGKRKVSKEVLFPNYLFVEFDQEAVSALSINYTRGVNRIVSFGNVPSQVPDQLISQLKERIDQSDQNMITELPEKGENLEVLDGPFRGLNAIFSQIDGDSRAIVLITILSQKVKAVLPLSSLARVGKANSRAI